MKKIFLVLFSLSLVFLNVGMVSAQEVPPKVPTTPPKSPTLVPPKVPTVPQNTVEVKLKNPLKSELNTIPKIINAILDGIVIPIAVPIFVLAIIWTGILFVIARGKPDDIKNAKTALKWTLIGGAVILGAKLISSAIAGTLGAITGTVLK